MATLAFFRKMQHLFDVARRELPGRAGKTGHDSADKALGQRARCASAVAGAKAGWRQQVRAADADALIFELRERGDALADQRRPERFVLARHSCQTAEMLDDGWLQLLFEDWQDLVPQAGTQAREIEIGSVLAPGLAERGQVLSQFAAAHLQERANNVAFYRIDGCQTRWARAANQSGQHGFRLVVGAVRHGHV